MTEMQKEIQKMEAAGLDVVAVDADGKLAHVTGGINQNTEFCDSCSFLAFRRDPDPYDWFHDNDQKAVCEKMKAMIAGALEKPSEMVNISTPLWCPRLLKCSLTEEEEKKAKERLSFDRSRYE